MPPRIDGRFHLSLIVRDAANRAVPARSRRQRQP